VASICPSIFAEAQHDERRPKYLAANCVFLLASIGTARATFLAVVCASYPLVVWWEARTLRGRNSEAADRLLIAATGVQLVLMTFASYAADLAKLGAGCPPQ
jgi:hypothetical protein